MSSYHRRLRYFEVMIVVLLVVLPLVVVVISYEREPLYGSEAIPYVMYISRDRGILGKYDVIYLTGTDGKPKRYILYIIYSLYCKWSLKQLKVIIDHAPEITKKYDIVLLDFTFNVSEVTRTHAVYRCIVYSTNRTLVPAKILESWIRDYLTYSKSMTITHTLLESIASKYGVFPSSNCKRVNEGVVDNITETLAYYGFSATPTLIIYDKIGKQVIAVREGYMAWDMLRNFLQLNTTKQTSVNS